MVDPIQIFWTPVGDNLPDLGARALVDVSDGDTPNIRMPIRMLSVDTPEVTAHSEEGARKLDAAFVQLAQWIHQDKAPVSKVFADYILPKLESGSAGSLQYQQGKAASAFAKQNIEKRLTRETGSKRNLFIRTADQPFDPNHRLLAYIAPNYSVKELASLSRLERSTFNLDLIAQGWASPFIIFPNIPGELDLPLYLHLAVDAFDSKKGIWADALTMPAYEYRMCEKLYAISKDLVEGKPLRLAERYGWRSRYCADMRTRLLYGPEQYMAVPPPYRLWIWPNEVQKAVSMLNLLPSAGLLEL
ncbi:thermonuclease family protein [uncultured Thiothrix sp.]|uniref:thermonuclease family protein n=1 Tax=uncultured Thiothrix sp. TaxID=223185 RepID=UPI0026393F16|nr:thermonuclease family protein [uncultured Thiothrix sp.]